MFGLFDGNDVDLDTAARLLRVERKLDAIIAHFNVVVPRPTPRDGLPAEVADLADLGPTQKIAAIKRHRELTGSDLRTAKRAVEDYLRAK
jgi:hypothetical protein